VVRNLDPLKAGVVTVGAIRSGTAANVIPQTAELRGTVRSLTPEVRDLLERRVREVAHGIAAAYGATARVEYSRNYPITVNHARETDFAVKIASDVAGSARVAADTPPIMAGEDFTGTLALGDELASDAPLRLGQFGLATHVHPALSSARRAAHCRWSTISGNRKALY
jgi:metal-dependent amidase/aminoacylase/carboxypeptidase family protein